MPIIVNVTILNGMDVVGEIVGKVNIYKKNENNCILFSLNGIHKIHMVNILNYHLTIHQNYGHGQVILPYQ